MGYLDEILLLNEKKENFFCASNALFKKIQILDDHFEEDALFHHEPFEDRFFTSLEKFSYKNALIGKNEKKLYILVIIIFFNFIVDKYIN